MTKNNFRDTLNFIIKDNEFKNIKPIRRDFISRTLIIINLKYDLNNKFEFLTYDIFKKELENTTAVMTRKLSLNGVIEIFNILNDIEENEEELVNNSEIELDNEISFDSISEDFSDFLEKNVKDITIDKKLMKIKLIIQIIQNLTIFQMILI